MRCIFLTCAPSLWKRNLQKLVSFNYFKKSCKSDAEASDLQLLSPQMNEPIHMGVTFAGEIRSKR